jgi:SAM-dependent methyltransferase
MYSLNKMVYNTKTYSTRKLFEAYNELKKFRNFSVSPLHERFIFPYICGTYFGYRKIDVLRVVAVAKSISPKPRYLDVGCGYGDFLEKIREFIPDAIGIEKDGGIFYEFNMVKPDYIHIKDVSLDLNEKYDVIFVGWMDPGVDFRKAVANCTDCIITNFDTGGQCGINGGCEYEEFGFRRIAWWKTPSWIDVNYQIMNKYYTPLTDEIKKELFKLRSAHTMWYIYTKENLSTVVNNALKLCFKNESQQSLDDGRYNFEEILDECGFHYNEELVALTSAKKALWNVFFE